MNVYARVVIIYRVRRLSFRPEQPDDLSNGLLRVSALGIFAYSVFSIIAGAFSPWTDEPPLLVMTNGLLSVIQVPN